MFSEMASWRLVDRLVLPRAARRRISTSRAVRPAGWGEREGAPPAVVYHLASGEVAPVSSYIVDGRHDIALFNVVRAAEPRPIGGIFAAISMAEPGQRAWMHAVMDSGVGGATPRFLHRAERGVNLREDAPPQEIEGFADRMAIKGMIPFGGASGAPVVDKAGYVIGIESGYFPSGVRTRSRYQGATVTRIRALLPMLQSGAIVRLQPVE